MKVGRVIGWVLLVAALAAAGYEADFAIRSGGWRPIALGELWGRLGHDSFALAQAAVQQHLAAWLWDPVIASILRLPGWFVFGAPAILLLRVCRERRPRRRFRLR